VQNQQVAFSNNKHKKEQQQEGQKEQLQSVNGDKIVLITSRGMIIKQ